MLEKLLENEIASSFVNMVEEHGLATFKDIKAVIEEIRDLRRQIAGAVSSGTGKGVIRKSRAGRKPKHETCTQAGCYNAHYAKGLCASHYQKQRREATEGPKTNKPRKRRGRKKAVK